MAGAGYKDFVNGDVLTATQVDTYLMEQSIMRFASASARDTALSTVKAEGMTAYLMDSNTLTTYDGTNWYTVASAVTPVWTAYNSPSLTNMTIGNGTIFGQYIQIGKTVHYRIRINWGSSTSVAGAISIALPVTASSTGSFTGSLTMRAGGVDYMGYIATTTTTIAVSAVGTAGTYANRVTSSATVPGTWASGDNITFSVTYEAA